MGGLKQFVNRVKANPIGAVTGALVGGTVGLPGIVMGANAGAKRAGPNSARDVVNGTGAMTPPAPASGIPTPAQAATDRDSDIAKGQDRWRQLFSDPALQDLKKRREDGLEGLNSQEMEAARGVATNEMRGSQQAMLRQLMAQQGRNGIRGGLAGAQQAGMVTNFANQRMDQERKMLLDNYQLKQNALDKHQDFTFRSKFGELAQGMGEAGLGVADRTGFQQATLAQQMLQMANKKNNGLLSDLFDF